MPDACQVSPFSSSRVILILVCICCMCLYVCFYVYVCVHLTLERKNPRKQLLFSLHTHLSLRATASRHPSPNARDISLPAASAATFELGAMCIRPPPPSLYFSRLHDVWFHLLICLPFLPGSSVRESDNIPTIRDIGHRGISLQPAFPEFSGDAVESNTFVLECNAPHVISRRYIMHFIAEVKSFRRCDNALHLCDTFNPINSENQTCRQTQFICLRNLQWLTKLIEMYYRNNYPQLTDSKKTIDENDLSVST